MGDESSTAVAAAPPRSSDALQLTGVVGTGLWWCGVAGGQRHPSVPLTLPSGHHLQPTRTQTKASPRLCMYVHFYMASEDCNWGLFSAHNSIKFVVTRPW